MANNTDASKYLQAAAANGTSPAGPAAVAGFLYANRHMFIMEARIVSLALFVIYVASHAALRRPHSAAPKEGDEDDEETGDRVNKSKRKKKRRAKPRDRDAPEGLQLSDAIVMPFVAAAALVGLYYLIQYLQDPALLNRAIRGYTALVSLASVGSFLGDGMQLAASAVFPNVWAGRDGQLYRIDAARQLQWRWQAAEQRAVSQPSTAAGTWVEDPSRRTPFPDTVAAWLPAAAARGAWAVRRLLHGRWSVRTALHGVLDEEAGTLTLLGAVGYVLAGVTMFLYYVVGAFPAQLNNLIGLSFSYFGLQVLSGTSFLISSVVLLGLFVYDIVMVFYTPFMITVATQVEAPIKLVAHSGGRASLLGLGDIVVPGIYICLCLRYDLYRFYAKQIKKVETPLETTEAAAAAVSAADGTTEADVSAAAAETRTTTVAVTREVKATFVDPQGRWGDRLWTVPLVSALTPGLAAATFPKAYFHTAIMAYLIGLVTAMGAMLVTGKGQPALLYLVPVILAATWGKAAATGDLRGMWAYTEDGGLDTKDVVVDVGADGEPIVKKDQTDDKKKETKEDEDDDGGHDVFSFVIRALPELDWSDLDI